MRQSLVIKTHVPLVRKYPGVPKVPEKITTVLMVSYREKNDTRFVLKTPEDYFIRWKMDAPKR